MKFTMSLLKDYVVAFSPDGFSTQTVLRMPNTCPVLNKYLWNLTMDFCRRLFIGINREKCDQTNIFQVFLSFIHNATKMCHRRSILRDECN